MSEEDLGRPPAAEPAASVIIPAHDEEAVIVRCLDALLADADDGEFEVVVAANACRDRTVERVRSYGRGVVCLDLPERGKTAALNAADAVAVAFPRIYLDADVVLATGAARTVVAALQRGALAAAPRPVPDATGCSWWIRAHCSVWSRLPVTREGYVGSGALGLSATGHRRIAPFPAVVAEDQYVRRSFDEGERMVTSASFTVFPARTVRAHVRRATRVRAGNRQLETHRERLRPETSPRGVRGVLPLLRDPRDWASVVAFVALSAVVRVAAEHKLRRGDMAVWERDDTSRRVSA